MVPLERKRRKARYRQRIFRPNKTKEFPQDNPCSATVSNPPTDSPPEAQDDRNSNSSSDTGVGCSTPRAERFRIPEQLSCPPAPKKRRVALQCSPDKSSIRFFNPPDLEIFFFFAFRNIST